MVCPICFSICGNSAYIIGSTVETERGLKEFLSIFAKNGTEKTIDIIRIFGQLLTHLDDDCVLNATGTLGTIVCMFQILNFYNHFHVNTRKTSYCSLFCIVKKNRID